MRWRNSLCELDWGWCDADAHRAEVPLDSWKNACEWGFEHSLEISVTRLFSESVLRNKQKYKQKFCVTRLNKEENAIFSMKMQFLASHPSLVASSYRRNHILTNKTECQPDQKQSNTCVYGRYYPHPPHAHAPSSHMPEPSPMWRFLRDLVTIVHLTAECNRWKW